MGPKYLGTAKPGTKIRDAPNPHPPKCARITEERLDAVPPVSTRGVIECVWIRAVWICALEQSISRCLTDIALVAYEGSDGC